jgi:hypothetical protein
MLTIALSADIDQAGWEAALDWANAHARPGVEPIFVDHGDQHVYLFAAA